MIFEDTLELAGGCRLFSWIAFLLVAHTTFQTGIEFQTLVISLYDRQNFTCIPPTSADNVTGFNHIISSDQCSYAVQRPPPESASWQKCEKWNFSSYPMHNTFRTDFNLVCDRAPLSKLFFISYCIGRTLACLLSSLGDRFGRKRLISICIVMRIICSFLPPFIYSLPLLLVLKVSEGFGTVMENMGLVYLAEVTPHRYRGLALANYYSPWCFGYAAAGLVTFLTREWRQTYLMIAILSLVQLPVLCLLPESPRWLVVKSRQADARAGLARMAKMNCHTTHLEQIKHVEFERDESARINESMLALLCNRTTLVRGSIMAFLMMSNCISYYGVSLDLHFATDNIFLNVVLMGLLELPGSFMAVLLADKVGRVWSTFATTGLTISCILVVPLLGMIGGPHMFWSKLLYACLGKFWLTVGFNIVNILSVEVFPTTLRNMGYAMITLFANLGTVLSTLCVNLDAYHPMAPACLFTVLFVVCMLLVVCFIPETKDLYLTDDTAEAQLIEKGHEEVAWKRVSKLRKMSHCHEDAADSHRSPPLIAEKCSRD